MIENLRQDLRYGLRMLFTHPGFAIAAVLTLGLGIGANTAIFSVINGLLLKPLPYTDGERLVQVYNAYPKMGLDYAGTSIPDYLDRKAQAPALEDLAIYTGASFNLSQSGAPQRLVGLRASPSLFSTLQAPALLGRVFDDEAATIGRDKVVVLSHAAWKNNFGSDANIIGTDVNLSGENYRVVGVMPQAFAFPNRNTQLWVPFAFTEQQKSNDERGNEYSESIGRLKPGATVEQLNSQMDAIVQRNAELIAGSGEENAADYAEFMRSGAFLGRSTSLREQWVGSLAPVLWLLQAVVAFVLLIACANVANLMLTRLTSRQKELSVRTAMGAGRTRIARQLLVESLLISLLGAIAGIAVAYLSLQLLGALGLSESLLAEQVGIDPSVLLFTLGVAMFTGVAFGLFPAMMQLSGKPYEVLKEGGRGNTGSRGARLTRNTLVVVQMALAVTLLVGAGLLIRSFIGVTQQSPGFDRSGIISVQISLPPARYAEPAQQERFFESALRELRGVPGVAHAAYVSNLPFGESNWTSSYGIEGKERIAGEPSPHGFVRIVDEDFFAAMRIPVLAGRVFTPADSAEAGKVVVIDELLAKKYFPAGDAIGKRISQNITDPGAEFWTIVGVVGTVKNARLSDEVKKESYYFSFRQKPVANGFLIAKTELTPASLIAPMREAVLRVDPEQPVFDVRTVDERIRVSLAARRAPMTLLVIFAALALVLSAIGIYSVLSFAVEQRTSEIGVRLAMGAQRRDVMGLVLRNGMRVVAAGLALGIVGALVLAQFMRSQLFGVGSGDPVTLIVVVAMLATVALVACWLPARRAAGTNPIVALRHE
jgi:predicted permease